MSNMRALSRGLSCMAAYAGTSTSLPVPGPFWRSRGRFTANLRSLSITVPDCWPYQTTSPVRCLPCWRGPATCCADNPNTAWIAARPATSISSSQAIWHCSMRSLCRRHIEIELELRNTVFSVLLFALDNQIKIVFVSTAILEDGDIYGVSLGLV